MEFSAILGLVSLIANLAMKIRAEIMRSDIYTPAQKAEAVALMEAAFASDAWRVHGDLDEVQAALKVINTALAPNPAPPV